MSRYVVDRGLIGQVWQHLKARDARPRPQAKARPLMQIKTQDNAPTELLIYDEISYWGIMAQDVADVLDGITGDLHVRLNSPGGDVFDGVAIYNMLADWDGAVNVTVDGIAASAASFIAQAGDRIVMNRGSQMMIHDAWGMCIGNASDMTEMSAMLNRTSGIIADIYADRAAGTPEDWRAAMRAESWYNASEAIAAGLADAMAPSRHGKDDEDAPDVEPEAAAASFDLSVFIFAGRDKAPDPPMPAQGYWNRNFFINSAEPVKATAVGPHEGTAKEGTWDKGANVGRLPSPMPVATAKKVYALYDASRVEDGKVPKDACSLPHHFVNEDGTPGAPSLNGVNAALSRLNQTQGYSDAEKATAERHLNGHKPSSESTEDHGDTTVTAEHADDTTGWADAIAHLTQPPEDDWPVLVAHLTEPAPSSAATEA